MALSTVDHSFQRSHFDSEADIAFTEYWDNATKTWRPLSGSFYDYCDLRRITDDEAMAILARYAA